MFRDVLIGDDRAGASVQLLANQRPGFAQESRSDDNVVSFIASTDADWISHGASVPALSRARKRKGGPSCLDKTRRRSSK